MDIAPPLPQQDFVIEDAQATPTPALAVQAQPEQPMVPQPGEPLIATPGPEQGVLPKAPTPPAVDAPLFQDAVPTPNGIAFDPIPPSNVGQSTQGQSQSLTLPASFSGDSIGSTKRSEPDYSGDSEDAERYAKRARDDGGVMGEQDIVMQDVQAAAAPATASTSTSENPTAVTAAQPPASTGQARPAAAPAAVGADGALLPPAYIVGSYQPEHKPRFGPISPLNNIQLKSLLNQVRQMKKNTALAYPFLNPVDIVALNVPHYPNFVTKPIDLGTIEKKILASDPDPKKRSKLSKADLEKGSYSCVADVVDDIRQIGINTKIFNGPDHWVTALAMRLEETFDNYLEKAPLQELPAPIAAPPPTPPVKAPSPAADMRARRPSVSVPTIRRNSEDNAGEASRPKREIHPPTPKDQAYETDYTAAGGKKMGREGQLDWTRKQIDSITRNPKYEIFVIPFLYPVDPTALGLPDYFTIIKKPMDISTIMKNFANHVYEDPSQVDADIRLMLDNCMKYNPPGVPVYLSALEFQKVWKNRWQNRPWATRVPEVADQDDDEIRALDAKIAELQSKREEIVKRKKVNRDKEKARASGVVNGSKPSKQQLGGSGKVGKMQNGKSSKPSGSGKPRKVSGAGAGPNGQSSNGPTRHRQSYNEDGSGEDIGVSGELRQDQKQALADKIQFTSPETLQHAIMIIQETTQVGDNGEEIELDIDALPPKTVVRLYNLVVLGLAGGKPKTKRRNKPKHGQGQGVNGGGKKKGVEQDRIKQMEQQLATFPDAEENGSDASSVAYSEEEYSGDE